MSTEHATAKIRRFFRRTSRNNSDSSADLQIQQRFSETQEPKKSILRSLNQRRNVSTPASPHSTNGGGDKTNGGSVYSMVDLREEPITHYRPILSPSNSSNSSNTGPTNSTGGRVSSNSVRSIDGTSPRPRNVLFLDEVERNKRHFSTDSARQNSRSELMLDRPTSPSSSFASYPASYQPSPLLARRDYYTSNDIELISRSPLPQSTPEPDSTVWVSSPMKHTFKNFSFSRGRRNRKSSGNEPSMTDDKTSIVHDVLANTRQYHRGTNETPPISPMRRPGLERLPAYPGILHSGLPPPSPSPRAVGPPMISPMATAPVRKPMYPRIVEINPKPSPRSNAEHSSTRSRLHPPTSSANRTAFLLEVPQKTLTDSTDTLCNDQLDATPRMMQRPINMPSTSHDSRADNRSMALSKPIEYGIPKMSYNQPTHSVVPLSSRQNMLPIQPRSTSYPSMLMNTTNGPTSNSYRENLVVNIVRRPDVPNEVTRYRIHSTPDNFYSERL